MTRERGFAGVVAVLKGSPILRRYTGGLGRVYAFLGVPWTLMTDRVEGVGARA